MCITQILVFLGIIAGAVFIPYYIGKLVTYISYKYTEGAKFIYWCIGFFLLIGITFIFVTLFMLFKWCGTFC